MVLEGLEVVKVARTLCGLTDGKEADVGTIRGDLAMSLRYNLVHASDSKEVAQKEIERFFKKEELFEFKKIDLEQIYSQEEIQKKH
jgi:nucleoside-diphosphate kinase